MGKFYLNKWTLTPLLLLVAGMAAFAQGEGNGTARLTQTVTYYGNWYGATGVPEGTPTMYKHFYYDKDNRLVGTCDFEPLFGDSETTVEVEVAGEMLPLTYTSYTYDKRGNLTGVKQRSYKVHDGYYRSWTDFSETETYTYDDNGKMTAKSVLGKRNAYTWEGDNMVADTAYSGNGTWQSTTRYSNFAPAGTNKPQSVLKTDKYPTNQYLGEYTYGQDGKGNLRPVSYIEYGMENIVTDAKGEIVSADKGTERMKAEWTYDGDRLAVYTTFYYDKSKGEFVLDKKTEYTIVDGNEKTTGYAYDPISERWTTFGTPSVRTEAEYSGANVPENFTVTRIEEEGNTVLLSCDAPANAEGTTWNVYRDGVRIGTAETADGKITYRDGGLKNGTYSYFIQASTEAAPDGNVTTPVDITLDTPLPCAGNIRVTNKGVVKEEAEGQLRAYDAALVEWDAPETELTVLGYNIYTDIKYYQTNPMPDNGTTLVAERQYELKWTQGDGNAHTIYVEAVYEQGKARSKAYAYVIEGTSMKAVKTVYTLGDAMGDTGDNAVSKFETYYYDGNNRLVSTCNNSCQLGDDPGTPEVEKAGDVIPYEFTLYDYNAAGQLTTVRKRTFGIYSGYDRAWTDFKEAETYEYDENGKVSKKTMDGRRYEYAWDGDKLVTESQYSTGTGNRIYTITYSDFVEGAENLPRHAVKNGTYSSNQRVIEYTYDENNNLVLCQAFKFGEKELDDDGNIVSVTKGTPDYEEKWTYTDGELTLYEKNTWKTAANAYQPNKKTVYTKTELGTREETFSYSVGVWTKNGTPKVVAMADFYPETAVTNARLTETAPNTIKITCTVPAMKFGSPVYNVYRNGVKVGEATGYGNTVSFTESQVPNGTWHYFVQPASESDNVGMNVSDILVYTSDVKLDAVQGIKVLENGTTDEGNYKLTVGWEKPETDLPVKGYNIYTNIKASTKNPTPDNGTKLINDTTYTFTWHSDTDLEKTVYVEVVYNIGKAMSEGTEIQLSSVPLKDQNSYVEMTKCIYTMGDAMGDISDETPSKVERYYYDDQNRISRRAIYAYLLGDNPDTPEVEQAGDIEPFQYFLYKYNDAGQLEKIQSRNYGVYSGYQKAWLDAVDTEVFEYNENGKLCKKTTGGSRYEYAWDGDKLVEESQYATGTGNRIYTITYSDFVEGTNNLPRRAVKNGTYSSNQRVIEYTYDENNRLVLCQTFKFGEKELDDNGNIISVTKGTPDYEEKWTYTDSELTLYEKNTWKTSANAYQPSKKTEYTKVELGTLAKSYSYFSGIWTKSGTPQITETAKYYKNTAPANLEIGLNGERANTVSITFEAPSNALGTVWNVYRNGCIIGTAQETDGKFRYDDENVPNGAWDYFVQSNSEQEGAEANISNAVTNVLATTLVPVTNIRVVKNGMLENERFYVELEWDAPETDLEILGYNVYSNVKDMTKYPAPDNGIDILTETKYSFDLASDEDLERTVYIETVYAIGKINSDPITFTLSTTPVTGIGTCEISGKGNVRVAGNNIIVDGEYESLDIYAANGISAGCFRNASSIDISSLATGVYIVKLTTAAGVETMRFVKK